MANVHALKSTRVIDGYRSIPNGVVVFTDGKITAIGPQSYVKVPEGAQVIDYGNLIISPGFIDIHCHGFQGKMAADSLENTLAMAEFIGKAGTTSFLPTVSTVEAVGKRLRMAARMASWPLSPVISRPSISLSKNQVTVSSG